MYGTRHALHVVCRLGRSPTVPVNTQDKERWGVPKEAAFYFLWSLAACLVG